ncbi:MAG: endonuclease/exonuclease/phosphatase family protein [Bacteroidota bacterium]
MKFMRRRIFQILKWSILLLIVYVGGFLLYGTLTDWQPPEQMDLADINISDRGTERLIADSSLTFLIWNMGFAGLGEKAHFFYDKGDFFWTELGEARAEQEEVEQSLKGVSTTIGAIAADFYLLQEVDTASRRSFYTQQLDSILAKRANYGVHFAMNFKNNRVPLPIFQPWDHYGYVRSGLLSMSPYSAKEAERLSLPGKLSWPTRLFSLDRCVLRQRFATQWGKDLVVYNVHLSAYDDGSKKAAEMAWLQTQLQQDYADGNYVVVGGDWNQVPPGFDYAQFTPLRRDDFFQFDIPFDYLPQGWKWVYDPATPSNRKTPTPYDDQRSAKTLIDFYLISPNIRVEKVQCLDQDFQFSDHQAVRVELRLQ